ncbi:hypothetical protein ACC743_39500, partial [Rhizobium ruizarguesonis]
IDKYVFDDSQSVKKLTIRSAKGTFRWVSCSSNSSAYQILTPAGTIGVRGTSFDFYVGYPAEAITSARWLMDSRRASPIE